MKNLRTYLILLVMVLIGGCTNFLDYNEEDFYTEDQLFEDFDRTQRVVNNIYSYLPNGFNSVGGAMRSSASDDAEEINSLENIQSMNDGRWSPSQTVDAQWGAMYSGIRAANRLLKNLDPSDIEHQRYADNYFELLDAYTLFDDQARFLRAYFYFELMRRYGSVPLLDGQILTLENVNSVQPDSFDDVTDFIVSELEAVQDSLPVDYSGVAAGPHKGRATRGAAMALKARTLLYAASPLHGSEQAEWEAAAAAAAEIINTGWYSLPGNYSNVVNNSGSNELIMGNRNSPSNWFERSNFPAGYEEADPGTAPTQNLVDTYEMTNGLDIDEAGSGYDPQNPYANRDPRLQQTVIVNNSTWKGRPVEIWQGGVDGLPVENATRTGYYLKKYVVEGVSLDPDNTTTARHLWVYFRYGEVLLNYAEAMNEAYGPNSDPQGYGMTAYDAVNEIRNRAGMPDFQAGMTQAQFREELREERRVELAFENHRFWDVRRWQIGDETQQIRGMEITQNTDGSFNYEKVTIENRLWDSKMNLYPLPQNELFNNSNLQQNPGW